MNRNLLNTNCLDAACDKVPRGSRRSLAVRTLLLGLTMLQLSHAEPFVTFPVSPISETGLYALAARLLDPGATLLSTPTLTGAQGQIATFTNFTTGDYVDPSGQPGSYGIAGGIILSTGNAMAAADTYHGGPSTSYGGPGDSRLTTLSGFDTYDAISLSFTFSTELPTFSLNYAFASAEYPDSVNTPSNDVMAIYLNGANIAILPQNNNTVVGVNAVNNGNPVGTGATNSNYFTQYSQTGVTPFAYGGITKLLSAAGNVTPGASNTLEIIIADGGDHIIDSAVIIRDWHGVTPGPNPGPEVPQVPEPSTALMFSGALLSFLLFSRARVPVLRNKHIFGGKS